MLVYQRVNLHFPMVFLWFSKAVLRRGLRQHLRAPGSASRLCKGSGSPYDWDLRRSPGNHPEKSRRFQVFSSWWSIIWLVVWNIFFHIYIITIIRMRIIIITIIIIFIYIYIGNNHPNWRTHIFQRGRSSTNPLWFSQILQALSGRRKKSSFAGWVAGWILARYHDTTLQLPSGHQTRQLEIPNIHGGCFFDDR